MVLHFPEGEERRGLTAQLEMCSSRLPIDRKPGTLLIFERHNLIVPSYLEGIAKNCN
jgi:hypothetical protein